MEMKFTESNFETEVIQSSQPVLVDFFAQWCGPCKMMGPIVEKLAEEYEGKWKIGKCDIDENMNLAEKYRVMSVPTFMIFKDRKAVMTMVGAISKDELEEKMRQVQG